MPAGMDAKQGGRVLEISRLAAEEKPGAERTAGAVPTATKSLLLGGKKRKPKAIKYEKVLVENQQ